MTNTTTPKELRIMKVSPYITPTEELVQEYEQLADLSLPKEIYVNRGSLQAKSRQLCSAKFIPDSLHDRQLLKEFEQIKDRVVDFGNFRRRVRAGVNIFAAAKTPLRKTASVVVKPNKKSSIRLAYENAPSAPVVSYNTYYVRVRKLKWGISKALYTPSN